MLRLLDLLRVVCFTVAALALGASTTSAQTLELSEEAGPHCGDVVMVNHEPVDPDCAVHFETEAGTTFDLFHHTGAAEVAVSSCEIEFEAAFDADGHGVIYNQQLAGDMCGREPCDEGEAGTTPHQNLAWETQLTEAGPPGNGEETLRMTFCTYPGNADPASEGTTGTNCTIDLGVEAIGHDYEVSTPPHDGAGNGGAFCVNLGGALEVEAHLLNTAATATHPGFEVHHLDDEGC